MNYYDISFCKNGKTIRINGYGDVKNNPEFKKLDKDEQAIVLGVLNKHKPKSMSSLFDFIGEAIEEMEADKQFIKKPKKSIKLPSEGKTLDNLPDGFTEQ